MRLQAYIGLCSVAKEILRSFKQSLHCHKLLVQIQILRVLCLRLVVVFLSPKKALKCLSTILLFNCGDLWCALHRLRWEHTTKKLLTFFGMHHQEKFRQSKLSWKELLSDVFWLGVYVVVQFYPWFKFSFLLFLGMVMYDNNMIMSLKQKKIWTKDKIEPQHMHRLVLWLLHLTHSYMNCT